MINCVLKQLDVRGYCKRTSIVSFTYNFRYTPTFPPDSYPSASPYAHLTRYYRQMVKLKMITSRLLKRLLYSEFLSSLDLSTVKRRQHRVEYTLTLGSSCRASIIACDSDSNDSSSDNDSSSESDVKSRRHNVVDSNTSSDNPFGYIRYYNTQTGTVQQYESFIDYGEVGEVKPKTAKLELTKQASEASEASSAVEARPAYAACEDLLHLDSETLMKPSSIPVARQSLPPKLVVDKYNVNSLTTICTPQREGSSSSSTTTHSSSLNLIVNPVPLPDAVLAELLYNFDDVEILKPPRSYRNASQNTANSSGGDSKKSNSLRRCISYQYLPVNQPDPCKCYTEPHCSSVHSADSGMADSYTLNSPDIPPIRCSSEMSNLLGDLAKFCENPEMEATTFESQCRCTSPFGSTPTTSCQASITTSVNDPVLPLPLPQESERQIHSKIAEMLPLRLPKCKSLSAINKQLPALSTHEESSERSGTFKSGLYAHWWLKAKIPVEVVRGIYEETRSGKGVLFVFCFLA